MAPRRFASTLVLALACGGKGDGGSGGSASVSASGPEEGSSTSGGATTSSASGSQSGSATGSSSSSDGGTSSGASSSSGGDMDTSVDDSSSSEGGGGSCQPAPGDEPCIECIKEPCCDDYTACENDAVCACTLDCVLSGSSLGSCKNRCNGDSELYEQLFFCGQMFCLNTCDWECC